MKKSILILGLLVAVSSLVPSQDLQAQTVNNILNGPRYASIPVVKAVDQWTINNGVMPDEVGEWILYEYSYLGRGVWEVKISWGTGDLDSDPLGTDTIKVNSSGKIIE